MPYKTDGTPHSGGIKNEINHVEYLNSERESLIRRTLFPEGTVFRHQGGTKTKADIIAKLTDGTEIGISVKNHKRSAGTIDWANSSKNITAEIKQSLRDKLQPIKDRHKEDSLTLDDARVEITRILNQVLTSFDTGFIAGILRETYNKNPEITMIFDESKHKIVAFRKEGNLKELETYPDWEYFLKISSIDTCTSASIWRRSNTEEINTHLRFRFILNNGVRALLGVSSANRNSAPCIHIQQDNLDAFIRTLSNPVIDTYIPVTDIVEPPVEPPHIL
jgi:hypothetical protein